MVKSLINQYPARDFILCIGDDKTDEDMFDALEQVYPNAITVMVDKKPTGAKHYLDRQSEVCMLRFKTEKYEAVRSYE